MSVRSKSKPPSQDRLILVFLLAIAIFAILSISPILFGDIEKTYSDSKDWVHKHSDGKGGIINLAENKTLIAFHHFMGKWQQQVAENNAKQQYIPMNHDDSEHLSLARGISGLPISQTPALVGAKHGTIRCPSSTSDENSFHMNQLAYWNEPQGDADISFVSPFAPKDTTEKRYVTFEPDRGGWNNIRMCK